MIALATKQITQNTLAREQYESDLTFLGLLVMENKLKAETSRVIQKLQDCNVRTVMATGDNVLTAISVARQCNIIDPDKETWLGELTLGLDGSKCLTW